MQLVVTDLGVLAPASESRRLTLVGIHPGVEIDDVREATGWDHLDVASDLSRTTAPTPTELAKLREFVGAALPEGYATALDLYAR